MNLRKALFLALALILLHPFFSSATALLLGVTLALTIGNPVPELTKRWTSTLLQASVVALGFGVDLLVVGKVGLSGVGYTVITIAFALGAGMLLARLLRVEFELGALIACGTAICGGSAIAAIAGAIKPKHENVTVSLAVVFLLNAAALFVFPPLGHFYDLTPSQFGLWSALAVHDTSSVLGTSVTFGPVALEVGTTVKLARALWITPLTLGMAWLYAKRGGAAGGKITIPYFILGFIGASALVTFVPGLHDAGAWIHWAGVRLLVLVLFLIGAGLSRTTLKTVGFRPLAQGVLLWFLVGSATLVAIKNAWLIL